MVGALAQDDAMAEAGPTAGGALGPVEGGPLGRAGGAVAGFQDRRARLPARAVVQRLLLGGRHATLAHDRAATHARVTAAAAARPVPHHPVRRAGLRVAGSLSPGQLAVGAAVVGRHGRAVQLTAALHGLHLAAARTLGRALGPGRVVPGVGRQRLTGDGRVETEADSGQLCLGQYHDDERRINGSQGF